MRSAYRLPLGTIIITVALFAAPQDTFPSSGTGPRPDLRPFGKYLVRICSVSGSGEARCSDAAPLDPPVANPPNKTAQSIAISHFCGAAPGTPCSRVSAGQNFTVTASSSAGLSVAQAVVSGNVTATPGAAGSLRYTVNGLGLIVIRATQPGNGTYAPARPAYVTLPVDDNRTPQIISLKQSGATASATAKYPLAVGDDFYISATSDSGLPVLQTLISGSVTPLAGSAPGPFHYHVNGPGQIVIRATQDGDTHYAPALPAVLSLKVADNAADAGVCSVFGPPAASTIQPVDLPGIIGLVGSPTPFVLSPQGSGTILIYSTRMPLKPEERATLENIDVSIAAFAGQNAGSLGVTLASAKPFSVELAIPHATALGDLATRISGLNFSQFTAQDVGSNRVRITATTQPDCATWTSFLSDVREMQWQISPHPMEMKLYYLSSSDAATAFAILPNAPTAPTASTAPAATTTAAGGSATVTASTAAPATPASNATLAITQPPGSVLQVMSNTTPCVVAGLTLSNSSACAPSTASASTPATPAAAPGPKPQPGMAAMAVAMAAGEQTPSDLLVFSDTNTGDDSQIEERKRILAMLDLPRPEMLINAWVMQNSTTNPKAMGAFTNLMRDQVAEYNEQIEKIVLVGWGTVKSQVAAGGYFDEDYYHYIADRYVADTYSSASPKSTQEASQVFLESSPAKMADPVPPRRRSDEFGICAPDRYCLGYNQLFSPLKPRLTDLLLTIIAAKDPVRAGGEAVTAVEGPAPSMYMCPSAPAGPVRDRCNAIWTNLDLGHLPVPPNGLSDNCVARDYFRTLASLMPPYGNANVHLQCFADAARKYLGADLLGVMRSALADFLFNYKLSQQYPHEFTPYDLSQSADALNSALSPIIDAFNRDVTAFQTFMRADMEYQVERMNDRRDERCCVKRLFGLDKPSFFNDGIVTVRTISGQWSNVVTSSQSAIDASTAPTISNVLSGLTASPAAGSTPASTPVGGVLSSGPLKAASAIAGAVGAYQSTYAQIGRQLSLYVIPRSLSTASAAELAITLNADETGGIPTYTGGPAGATAPNTSLVANHDTQTRFRVQSVNMLEVSSLSAVLRRSRSRFPLLPPFVEIPYIGTLAGIPLPGTTEYHASTAVMSAMVVPTAADIAFGLRFQLDQVVDGDKGLCSLAKGTAGPDVKNVCRFRRAVSLTDLNKDPIVAFHRAMINCFATGMTAPLSSINNISNTNRNACRTLTFDAVPRDMF